MSDPDVIVVGAGAAGLSAASALRSTGRSVLVLEAHRAIGGRARIIRPNSLHGALLDEGATWLHQVDRNPLVDLARAAGDRLHPGHEGGRQVFLDGRRATSAETTAYDQAGERWQAHAERLAAGPDDDTLSSVGDTLPDDPWLPNVETWEGAIIAAADADLLSLKDWHANQLSEPDLRPHDGVGTLLRRHLGPRTDEGAGPVRCGVLVSGIDWSTPGQVTVHTSDGPLRCSGCIVTVSTGVLRDGRIRFTPTLPATHLAALDGLPMGLLSKLALPIAPDAGFDLPDGTLLEQRLGTRDAAAMLLSLRRDGSPLLTGFLGGRHAWSYVGRETESLVEARDRLRTLLGPDALRGIAESSSELGRDSGHALGHLLGHASRWGSDPLFLGSYAYARPGHAGSRATLGLPFADGRIMLAGEATSTDGLAGTVGGAINEGARAAAHMLAVLTQG